MGNLKIPGGSPSPGWAVTFDSQKTSPMVSVRCDRLLRFLLRFIPEVTVSGASALISLTLFVQPWPAKPAQREVSSCAPFCFSQGNCWQQFVRWEGEAGVAFLPLRFPSWVTSDVVRVFSLSYKNVIFYGVSCLAAQREFEGVRWGWRKRLACPPPEELRG